MFIVHLQSWAWVRYKSSRWRKIVDKVGPKADPRPLDITFINRIMTVHTQLFFKLVAQLFFEKLRRLHCNVERYFFNHLFYQRVRSQLVSNNLICLFKSHSSIFFNFLKKKPIIGNISIRTRVKWMDRVRFIPRPLQCPDQIWLYHHRCMIKPVSAEILHSLSLD